jgi:hypothetical protein
MSEETKEIYYCAKCNNKLGELSNFGIYTVYCPVCFVPHKLTNGVLNIYDKK